MTYPPASPCSVTAASTGILTGLPSLTPDVTSGLNLDIDLPWEDEPSPGNLRFSASRIFTVIFATYADILTSISSIPPHDETSPYNGTLPYQFALTNQNKIRSFGIRLKAPLVFGARPLDQ